MMENNFNSIGYLRSDGYGIGGQIYLQAFGSIRVVSSFSYFTEYSIYTDNNNKDWITIVPQSSVLKLKDKSKFLIGNASLNGTLAQVSAPLAFKTKPLPKLKLGWIPLAIEIFLEILDAGKADTPSHVDAINPITNKPYSGTQERELVKKLTPAQRKELLGWINSTTRKVILDEKEVFSKGKIDPKDGCLTVELTIHFGDFDNPLYPGLGKDITHSKYATQVTGANGDFFVLTPVGNAALFDGLVNSRGRVVQLGLEKIGSVGEVKTGYEWVLRKNLPTNNPNYVSTPITEKEEKIFRKMESQIRREAEIAEKCEFKYFLSFSNEKAAQAAKVIFGRIAPVYYIRLL